MINETLPIFHHLAHDFLSHTQLLISLLEQPKETHLSERFHKINAILGEYYCVELFNHVLHDKQLNPNDLVHPIYSKPQLLLRMLCYLICTDSVDFIAKTADLTPEEVLEFMRELSHNFSIESLLTRIRAYSNHYKHLKEEPSLQKERELLGIEYDVESKDTSEERKHRFQRRHGHSSDLFDIMTGST